jgi:hypothetical protein
MAKSKAIKVRVGYVATLPESSDFRVSGEKPSGLYIHGHEREGIWLTYAGLDNAAAYLFELPKDADVLRSLASAIRQFADDPEHWRIDTRRRS